MSELLIGYGEKAREGAVILQFRLQQGFPNTLPCPGGPLTAVRGDKSTAKA